VLGGGQSLLPLMALRLAVPEVLVDITAAPDLAGCTVDDTAVLIRAGVTARRAEVDPAIAGAHPLLAACLAEVGHVEIRTRGTVCGSVAHADPAAELPALLLALDATVSLAGPDGERRMPAAEFFQGPYSTALDDGEVLAGVELPRLAPAAGWSVREIARRHGDFALAGVISVLELDSGRCVAARVALFGVSSVPVRAAAVERALIGRVWGESLAGTAAEQTFDGVAVLGDLHGSATYRRRAGVRLVRRALLEAGRRAADA
jgi:carbon-monoxide dehydrogenase medium subunit